MKSPDKLDLNYEFPKDVAGRTFSNYCLQRKLFNGEVMQLKWLVYSAGKLDILLFCKLFSRFMLRYSFSGVELRGHVHPQKFSFVETWGEIPENSGTEVSTPLFTTELSDFFLQKNIFGPVLMCA